MSIRDERAAAITRRYRDLSDNFTRALPGLLDELETIDEAHNLSELPRTGAEAAKWAQPAHAGAADGEMTEAEAALLAREMGRTTALAAELLAPTEQAATPAKPATRRRTAR